MIKCHKLAPVILSSKSYHYKVVNIEIINYNLRGGDILLGGRYWKRPLENGYNFIDSNFHKGIQETIYYSLIFVEVQLEPTQFGMNVSWFGDMLN